MTAPAPGRHLARPERLGLLVVAFLVAGLSLLHAVGGDRATGPSSPALQLNADTSQFRAGNIISDNLFFDGWAMSATDVQGFLDMRGATCKAGAMPCLKDYRQDTWTRPADSYCNAYSGAANESAATIVAKVGQACGVSQRVLLVITQKEEGLVNGSGSTLTTTRYRSAMGYGCPDTAPCDTQYYGFYNQMYKAAWQYKVYAANPKKYGRWAGATVNVQWNPSSSCGSSPVYIENQATAGLYDYTPYQPNQAALQAGYGSGDSCSAYGNRNFWLYYTDWFGSTQSAGGNAVVARAIAPGASTVLGSPTGGVNCGLIGGGCYQVFQYASIYWSPTTGAQIVKGLIRDHWGALGWETGRLGYPTGEEVCGLTGGGCYQNYQNGMVYWAPAPGAWSVRGAIKDAWAGQGWETGPLGYPTSDENCGLLGGGCYTTFQNGSVYWSPATGAQVVQSGPVMSRWGAQGWETGSLGYPTGGTVCGLTNGGCGQNFQKGAVYWTQATGARVIEGAIRSHWTALGWETGQLGYPIGEEVCGLTAGGCYQDFQHATVYTSPGSGAWSVRDAIKAKWGTTGWEGGALGYPVSDQVCGLVNGGCFTDFQHGIIYSSPAAGVHVVASGPVQDAWDAQGWETGPLGYPTTDTRCGLTDGGCFNEFQGGAVYSSSSTDGQVLQNGAIRDAWNAQGWETGPLGYPTATATCGLVNGACSQAFQHGTLVTSPASGTHAVTGDVATAWKSASGVIGLPTSDQTCGLASSGCVQQFQGASVYDSAQTDPHWVRGAIRDSWAALSAQDGPLGYPVTDEVCGLAGGGCSSQFQGGAVYFSPASGAHAVTGPIRNAWVGQGSQAGQLGYPTADVSCGLTDGGCKQQFQGGSLYWSTATGAQRVIGAIRDAWVAQSADAGALGYPVTGEACGLARGGCFQTFQHGWIYFSPASGAHVLSGAVQAAWARQGWEGGPLGYPTAEQTCGLIGGGCSQRFQGGSVFWSPASGAWPVWGLISGEWASTSSERGSLGYPTSGENCGLAGGGCYQSFAGGWIYFSPGTGAHRLSGPIQAAWAAQGWEAGPLGYPTGEPVTSGSKVTQRFQGGSLVQDTSTGTVTRG